MGYRIPIDFKDSFGRREPVIKAAKIKHAVITDADGKPQELELERELGSYSPHEQDVIRFVLNPLDGIGYFSGLDIGPATETAKALYETYTTHNGKW